MEEFNTERIALELNNEEVNSCSNPVCTPVSLYLSSL